MIFVMRYQQQNTQVILTSFLQSIEDLKFVEKEATKGIQMAPTFQGVLSCCQLKMASSIMLECATELEGVFCFLPLHCLPQRKKENIKSIIEAGLSTILNQAQKRSYLQKRLFIPQKRQDQIDPYLSCLHHHREEFEISKSNFNLVIAITRYN